MTSLDSNILTSKSFVAESRHIASEVDTFFATKSQDQTFYLSK